MSESPWSLRGKVVVITGATGGLGRATALALARMGARLRLICRDRSRAEHLCAEIAGAAPDADVRVRFADLGSLREVRRVATELLATGEPVHVLLNNAGAVFGFRRQVSVDGFEMTFALNHLAYFALTVHLLDRLQASAPARIVNVASDAYVQAKGRFAFDDLNATRRRYSPFRQYARSKLANLLFTRELARRLRGTGVTANAASPPGLTATRFAHNTHPLAKVFLGLAAPFCVTAEEGARPLIHLCSAPAVDGLSGTFFVGMTRPRLAPAAEQDDDALRLWEISTEAVQAAAEPVHGVLPG